LDARLSHVEKAKKRQKRRITDRHGWNTLEDYNLIFHNQLDSHPFIDHSQTLPDFNVFLSEEGRNIVITLDGKIYCNKNVVVEIRKTFQVTTLANDTIKIRGEYYCYNASISGERVVLRYDNLDKLTDYHKHIFDDDGNEVDRVSLSREQFPLIHEVIEELYRMFP